LCRRSAVREHVDDDREAETQMKTGCRQRDWLSNRRRRRRHEAPRDDDAGAKNYGAAVKVPR
jgi:hypothetical protein